MLFNFPYFFKYKTYFILCLVSLNSLSLYKPASSTHCFCWLLSYVFVIFDCELIFLETVSEFLQRQYVLLLSVTWKALKICYHFKFLVWGFFRLPRLFKQTSFRAACDYIYIYILRGDGMYLIRIGNPLCYLWGVREEKGRLEREEAGRFVHSSPLY